MTTLVLTDPVTDTIIDANWAIANHANLRAVVNGGIATGNIASNANIARTQISGGIGMQQIFDFTAVGALATLDSNTILGGNLPSTYASLKWVLTTRTDNAVTSQALNMRFNNDSTAIYDAQWTTGSAATVAAVEAFAQTSCQIGASPGASATASVFGQSVGEIANYRGSTSHKTLTAQAALKFGTASTNLIVYNAVGFYRSTSVISRIQIIPPAGNFVADTRWVLYGLT